MKDRPDLVRTPLAELVSGAPPLGDLFDPAVVAWAGRLRAPPTSSVNRPGHEQVAIATIVRAPDGGPLNTFSGALNHECGLQHCLKADRALGWEGEAARDLLAMLDCEFDVDRLSTESVRVESIANDVPFSYTADVEVTLKSGAKIVIEVKRGPEDLRDPRLRAVLATVTEVFRRIGVTFIVVYRDAIWRNRHHRRNCEMLGATRFTPPTSEEIEVARDAVAEGATFGDVAELLAPGRPARGRAKVRALMLRGHVAADLTVRIGHSTPLHLPDVQPDKAPPTDAPEENTMRPFNRLTRNTIIRIRGADHVFNGRVGGLLNITHRTTGLPYAEPNAAGVTTFIDDGRLADMLASDEATLHSVGGLRARLLADAGEVTVQQALAADPAVRKMLRQIEMLDDAKVSDGVAAIERHMKEHWTAELVEEFGPADPPGTLRHWRRTRGVSGKRHPREMIRMWGRKRRGDYSADFVAELLGQSILDAKSHGEGHKQGYALFSTALQLINDGRHPEHEKPDTPFRIPHPATYKRWWDQAIEEETELPADGPQGVDQNWHGAGRMLQADYAMHRVVIDHTRLDLWVVAILDDGEIVAIGRPWLSIANDVATRTTVAHLISFIPPSAWTLGEMMRRMALPKRPPAEEAAKWPILVDLRGVPVELVVDSGTEFRTYAAERAFKASGVSVRWCKRKAPRQRARGERRVDIIAKAICDDVKGRTMPIKEARRVGYDPSKYAVAELDQLEGIANLAVAMEVRARLIMAKRTLDPSQSLEARENAARMLEATRLRQLAGNVVWAHTALPQPVSAYDLIPQDRAALTAFDSTILSPRPIAPPRKRRTSTRVRRDVRDAGEIAAKRTAPTTPPRRRSAKGGYR